MFLASPQRIVRTPTLASAKREVVHLTEDMNEEEKRGEGIKCKYYDHENRCCRLKSLPRFCLPADARCEDAEPILKETTLESFQLPPLPERL